MLDYADICIYVVMFRISMSILNKLFAKYNIGILVQDIISLCDCSNVVIAETANKISQI